MSDLGKCGYIQVREWPKSKPVNSFLLAQYLLSRRLGKYRRQSQEEERTLWLGGVWKDFYLSRTSSKINVFLFPVSSSHSFAHCGTKEIPATLEEESHPMAKGLLGARTEICLGILNSCFKSAPDKKYSPHLCNKTIPVHMLDQPLPNH